MGNLLRRMRATVSPAADEMAAGSSSDTPGLDSTADTQIHVKHNGTRKTFHCKKGTVAGEFRDGTLRDFFVRDIEMLYRYDDKSKKMVSMPDDEILMPGWEIHLGLNQFSKIKMNTKYQIWSPVSQRNAGLLEWIPSTNNFDVVCSGAFDSELTRWIAIDKTQGWNDDPAFAFVLDDTSGKQYTLKGNGEGREVTIEELKDIQKSDKSNVFQPSSIGTGIFSRLKQYRVNDRDNDDAKENLYLGCDHEGRVTLVRDEFAEESPSPQIIFILSKVGVAEVP